MAGAQAGHLDVVSGPGTLNNAWFVEGRAKLALGSFLGNSIHFNPVLGGNAGYASGNLSTTTLGATSTYWSVTLAPRLNGTPITGFVGFHHYTNKVDGIGTVWDENLFKGGIKVDFSSTGTVPPILETSEPFPYVLRTNYAF